VWAFDRAAGRRITRAIVPKYRCKIAARPSLQHDRRPGELVLRRAFELRFERVDRALPGPRNRQAMLGHRQLDRSQPSLVGRSVREQSIPLAHSSIIARRVVSM
jgi:hypothetical protein